MYWIQGFNARVGVINLNNKNRSTVFYAASNFGVLYDWRDKAMHILQGHNSNTQTEFLATTLYMGALSTASIQRNMVTNISSDASGKWLVTADSGSENVITVWDSNTRYPQRTLFTPLGSTRICKTIISADAKYLLVLGYQDKAIFQLWIWAFGLNEPHGAQYNERNSVALNCLRTMKCAGLMFPDPSSFTPRMPILRRCDAFLTNLKAAEFHQIEDSKFRHVWLNFDTNFSAKTEVDLPRDPVLAIAFNPYNSAHFALITLHEFWIGAILKIDIKDGLGQRTIGNRYELRARRPDVKTNVDCGRLTCFTFVESTSQVLVGTSRGALLVYGYSVDYRRDVKADGTEKLRFIKALKLGKEKINVMNCIESLVLIANDAGEIQFYDDHLKLIHWLPRSPVIDHIKGIGFDMSPRTSVATPKTSLKQTAFLADLTGYLDGLNLKLQKLGQFVVSGQNPLVGGTDAVWSRIVTHRRICTGSKAKTEELKAYGRNEELEEIMRGPDKKKCSINVPKDTESLDRLSAVRDFILCSHNCGVWFMNFSNDDLTQILDFKLGHTTALSVHVDKALACIGFANGRVELLDFQRHRVLTRLDLRLHYEKRTPPDGYSISSQSVHIVPELVVTCLEYAPSGTHLACGLDTGELLFLHPTTIDILTEKPFRDTGHSIKTICFSCDSSTLALVDTGRTVCVYGYSCERQTWVFIGKHRAHYKNITCLFFTTRKRGNHYRLFSIGEDRIMVEYDIGSSSEECLAIFSTNRIDQTAVPSAAMEWPVPEEIDSDIPTILVSNDELTKQFTCRLCAAAGLFYSYAPADGVEEIARSALSFSRSAQAKRDYESCFFHKYKIINYDTATTLATYLGPRYHSPLSKLRLVRNSDEMHEKYMAFVNRNVIGLQKLPLDGNPYKHVGVMGHPIRIHRSIYVSAYQHLLQARSRSVERAFKHGKTSLNPYYCLLEGGRTGWLFREMRDLFYYIQIICQGTFSTTMRRIGNYIPIASLPDLMRALGFFPSQYEVENLLTEAKYKIYEREPSVNVDFEEFVKLYLNHRPAFGDSIHKIKNAFKNFADVEHDTFVIRRADFVDMLNKYGECFSNKLSWYLLSILSSYNFEDRTTKSENDFSFLPESITLSQFLSDIIGLQSYDNLSEQHSLLESLLSEQDSSMVLD
ncbi:Cilia- and flagella-associated protein 251 [Eumeta japonica]|uniref:Cilia-and flagella-associated protein 251 n=1 Tax=Eumeta variegata TaxID=151549 RepID=A0A4C1XKA8_EUMVA|nr:Cilia- and flagella-associated protein 251 [Eumeta japonica]